MTTFPKEIVVSDASPIISLERIINGHQLLSLFFSKIFIPEQVMFEIYRKHYPSAETYLVEYGIQDIIAIHQTTLNSSLSGIDSFVSPQNPTEFKGEAYAISLAHELGIPLLVDDIRAAKVAFQLGIPITDMAFQAVYSYRQGIVEQEEAERIIHRLYSANVFDIDEYVILLEELINS